MHSTAPEGGALGAPPSASVAASLITPTAWSTKLRAVGFCGSRRV
jgi:hypothetical protein